MPAPGQSRLSHGRFTIDSDSITEVVFLLVLIFMIAGPISGLVLWAHSTLSALFSKGAYQVESTRNLANQLLVASDRIHGLETKLADSELEITRLRQEAKDTKNLRRLLGLRESLHRRTIAADVVSRDPDNWFSQLTLDKGGDDGVRRGSAVITSQGVVGQVITVGPKASVVKLITDPDQQVGVMLPRINTPGVLSGRQKDPPVIEYVPVGTAVDVGDKVTCQGNGGAFPEGHPVGVVTVVKRDTNGTTLNIEIRPSENFFDLTHVLIVPTTDG